MARIGPDHPGNVQGVSSRQPNCSGLLWFLPTSFVSVAPTGPRQPRNMHSRRLLVTAASALVLGLGAPAISSAATVTTDGLQAEAPAAAKASAASVTTGDPNLVDQWALASDRAMGMTTAWNQVTGGDVIVAVIDSGVKLDHPEFAGNLWTNTGEIDGNGIDDDHNGFVDDIHGYDFIGRDADPSDANGHGTHVAGIIGARGDNHVGGSGVAQQVKLMAVRVLDANASGTTAGGARGLKYAVDTGAKIINLSLAGPSGSDDLLAALLYAELRGVVVVAAAGNNGADLTNSPAFPASYITSNIVGVAATREDLDLSDISNYGNGADIAAPGEDILSTASDGGYEWRTGTSMAAPAVAGTLALISSARPDLDAGGLRNALYGGATHSGLPVGTGSVNATSALRQVIPAESWKTPEPVSTTKKLPPLPALPTAGATRKSTTTPATAAKSAAKKKACRKVSKRASKKAKARYKSCVRKAKLAKAKAAKRK